MVKFSKMILRLLGWNAEGFTPSDARYILIVAPHTSWRDFVIGKLALEAKGVPAVFLIKKEFFIFPIRRLLKRLGGLPVDRRHAGGIIESTASLLDRYQDRRMAVVITPEGTRRRTENWKKGFYVLARRTQLPVYAGIVDYRKKTCDILPAPLVLDKPFEAVMKDLSQIYKGAQGKHPGNFNF